MNLIKLSLASVAGNANADFVVPANGIYRILYGHLTLTTDATVANRIVELDILDDAGTPAFVFDVHAGAVVTASSTNQHFEFMPGIYRETAFVNGALQIPIPQEFLIPRGYTIRYSVTGGVVGDSFSVNMVVESKGLHR